MGLARNIVGIARLSRVNWDINRGRGQITEAIGLADLAECPKGNSSALPTAAPRLGPCLVPKNENFSVL
jgi:hypothetical protein